MGLLRKTTQILHLEPGSDAWVKQGAFVPAREGISPEELQPLLKTLLSEPSLESAEAQRVLARLRELSTKAGPFLTASEIQRCLLRFKFRDEEGVKLCPARAYELASKLHWEHLHRQIEAIEAESKPLGPTVFATFLEEMVECLLRGDEPRKSAEIPVVLADELLARLLEPSLHALDYVVLAERSIGTALDCCRLWRVEEAERAAAARQEDDAAAAAAAAAAADADADAEIEEQAPTVESRDEAIIDSHLVDYLKELDTSFRRLSLDLHELMFPIDTCKFVTQRDESRKVEQSRAYLEVLVGIAEKADYPPMAAMALEVLSDSVREDSPELAREYADRAVTLYATEAKKDSELRLSILSQKRAHAAERLRRSSDSI